MAGLRLPGVIKGKSLPPGRGVLFGPSDTIVLQVASAEVACERPGMPAGIAAWSAAICAADGLAHGTKH
jgi:hypothetical protein